MKRIVLASALFVLTAASAQAAGCTYSHFGFTPVPDYSGFTQSFDDFTASVGDPATCSVQVDITDEGNNPIPAGTVIAYTADYRGFLRSNSTAKVTVENGGFTSSAQVVADNDTDFNDVYLSNIVGTNTGSLDSQIDLEMLTWDDSGNIFTLDTIDYAEIARTTMDDIQASLDDQQASRIGLITHLNATADLLSGAGRRLDDEDGVTVLGGVGSFSLGATGRKTLGNGFSVSGGVGFLDQTVGDASASGVLLNASGRYLAPDDQAVRPFVEAGLIAAPSLSTSFARSYETSIGTINATDDMSGSAFGGYLKAGVLFAPNPDEQLIFSASLAQDWLKTGSFSEDLTVDNPFALSSPAQTQGFTVAKVGVDWSKKITPQVDVTLSAAVGATMANDDYRADVAFAGSFMGEAESELFAEYGARAEYEIDPAQSVGVFLHASTGAVSGTHAQIGADYHVRF